MPLSSFEFSIFDTLNWRNMKSEPHLRVLLTLSSILLSVDAACTSNDQPNVLVRLCCPASSDESTGVDSADYPRSITLMGNVNNNSSQHKVRIGCSSAYSDSEVFYLDR